MLYAVDIGNSTVSIGIFDDDRVLHSFGFPTSKGMTVHELEEIVTVTLSERRVSMEEVSGSIVASVVPELDRVFREVLREAFDYEPVFVDYKMDLGITVNLASPEDIGIDRLVNACAANKVYDEEVIIVDFGTAITFDHLTAEGKFSGGVIAPGAKTALDALISRASRIGDVEPEKPERVIGKDTKEAVRSGIFYGYLGLVCKIINKIKQEIGKDVKVIATGGAYPLFEGELDLVDVYDEHLTLKGLINSYRLNVK